MSTNIKVIKFTTKVAVVLAVITYLISLNISYEWFDIKWCSNSFLLTIFGGAFASTLVVLICEIQKYQQNKKDTSWLIFRQLGSIYGWLKVIESNLKKYQDDKKLKIDKEILVGNVTSIKQTMDMFLSLDYTTYRSTNESYKQHQIIKEWMYTVFTPFVSECMYLQMAVVADQIEHLQKHGVDGTITSASHNTGKTINILVNHVSNILLTFEEYLQFIDNCNDNEFNWASRKVSLDKVVDIDFAELSDFLKQED